MGKETKNLVIEVSLGIVIYTLAVFLAALLIYPKKAVFLGLLLGMVMALAMFFSMAEILDRSMQLGDPKTVQKRTVIGTVIRYLILIIVMVVVIVWFSDQINAVAVVIGVLGLKAGAYLQPVIHRVLARKEEQS